MHDKQIDFLMETAQKVFVDELKTKIDEIERALNTPKDELTESEIRQLARFFHSIKGTAATLGLDYLSSIGKEWEEKLTELNEKDQVWNKDILNNVNMVINSIKKKISNMGGENYESITPIEKDKYINMSNRGEILLIDDDISILKLLENALSLDGYKVYICDDSKSALDMIAVTRPDIIILDIMMPGLTGYEILEQIKSKPEYSDMYIIFLSAKSNVDDKIKGIKSGADDYISKPFAIGEVVTRVEMLMRRSIKYREKLLKDTLTDAYSRYYFNLKIAEEFERYKRYGTVFSIAFIDMDHYKVINDQYGHQVGDYALKELVSHISKNIRKCDSVYRYGGEEFIILLPETTEEKAYELIERLRQRFNRESISVGGITLNVTFSAGIKQVHDKDESIDQIVGAADKAMYYAKKSGRNKVFVYSDEINTQDFKKTLLIVDDENTILKLLRDRLINIGYNVITAENGKNAIKLAKELQPDAVILDLVLPDIDGYDVLKRIKEDQLICKTKIIMLSKRKEKKNIVKGFNFGADDYVTKPFSMEELEARIMRVLNSSP